METLGTAVVEILGDLSRLAQALREAERQTKQGMKRAGEVGKRAFLAAFRGVKAALKTILVGAIAAVGTAVTGLGAVIKSAFDYAPVENMRRAFEGLAVSAGSTGKAILKAMKEATGGTIAARDAMKAFDLAAQLVSVDFAMKLPEAMQYLQKVSAATGESMDFLLESLVRGVGRLSPMILDNLAIQVNLTEAYKAYAKQIGKSVSALTKQEKQMALMNQVLELLRRNTEAMPDITDSAAVAWQRMKAAFRDVRDAIGRLALPVLARVLGNVADWASNFAQAVQDLFFRIEEGRSVLLGVRNVLEAAFGKDVGGRIFDIVVKVIRLFRAFKEGGVTGEKFRQVLAEAFGPDAVNIVMSLVDGFQKFTETLQKVRDAALPFIRDVVIPFIREHSREILAALLAIGAVLGGAVILGAITTVIGALAALLNPLTLIAAAAGLLAAAWTGNWGGIRDTLMNVWATVGPVLQTIMQVLKAVAQAIWNTLAPAFMGLWQALKDAFSGILPALAPLMTVFKALGVILGVLLVGAIGIVVGLLSGLAEAIRQAAKPLRFFLESVMTVIQGYIDLIKGMGQIIIGFLTNNEALMQEGVQRMKEGVLSLFKGMVNGIVGLIATLVSAVGGLISGFVNGIIQFFTNLYMALVGGSIIPDMARKILGVFRFMVSALFTVITGLTGFIVERFSQALEAAKQKFVAFGEKVQIAKKILEGIRKTFSKVKSIVEMVIDAIKRLADMLANLDIPKWLKRESPAPIELAFAGWQKHLRAVTLELPRLERHLDVLDRAGVVNQTQRVSNWNITLRQVSGPEEFLNMLRLAQATEGF